jgi:hypothetical protein
MKRDCNEVVVDLRMRSAGLMKGWVEDSKQIEYEASLDTVRQPGGLRC